jgi:hypothetical protein
MTQEERLFISAEDILELEFRCSNAGCGLRLTFQIDKSMPPPMGCPACNAGWFVPHKDDERKTTLYAFIDSVRKLREMKSLPFTLRLRVSSREGA